MKPPRGEKPAAHPAPASPGPLPARLARAVFAQQLRLRRSDKGFKLVLEDPKAAAAGDDATPEAAAARQAQQMCERLAALLDAAPGIRRVLRHLAAVEHGLAHKDADGLFLFDVPVERLRVALRQLDGLLGATVPPELDALRVRLLDAIAVQEKLAREAAQRQPISSFFVDHKLQVRDASNTDFQNATAEWDGGPPGASRS